MTDVTEPAPAVRLTLPALTVQPAQPVQPAPVPVIDYVLVKTYRGRSYCDMQVSESLVHDERYCDSKASWIIMTDGDKDLLHACSKHMLVMLRDILPERKPGKQK